ncbi:MAG: CRISPR-associated endoribonuclease Cas6 [bacterium]
MKIKIFITNEEGVTPLPYQNKIVGGFNKILNILEGSNGRNTIHDSFDVFNLSNILDTEYDKSSNSVRLIKDKSHFIISHPDINMIKKISDIIVKNKKIFNGFTVYRLVLSSKSKTNLFINRFFVNGIILKYDSLDEDYAPNKYYTFTNNPKKCNSKMKRLVMNKLEMTKEYYKSQNKECPIDFTENDFDIYFDLSYSQKRVIPEKKSLDDKFFYVKNLCPVIITGHPKIANFISTVGVGNFTKQGYGRII